MEIAAFVHLDLNSLQLRFWYSL